MEGRCGITLDRRCNTTECFVMLPQPPYVIIPDQLKRVSLKQGFRCLDGKKAGVDGVIISLLSNLTVWKGDEQCYVGEGCTFGEMVDWVAAGTRLVMLGAMIRTPERRRMENITMGVSIVDDELVVVGQRELAEDSGLGREWALLSPLDPRVWIAAAGCFALCVVAVAILKYSKPLFEEDLTAEEGASKKLNDKVLEWIKSFMRGVGAVFGFPHFAGNRVQHQVDGANISTLAVVNGERLVRTSWRLGIYNLSVLLLSFVVAAFFVMWILFYQASLTNYLFQQAETPLGRSVRSLNDAELRNYSVLDNSGVSQAWAGVQLENTMGYEPWQKCDTIQGCFEELEKTSGGRLILPGVVARFHIVAQSRCKELDIFKPSEELYKFNGGFLYGLYVKEESRKQIDEELLNARLINKIQTYNKKFLPKPECFEEELSISWKVFIVPAIWCNVTLLLLIIAQIVLIASRQREPVHQSSRATVTIRQSG